MSGLGFSWMVDNKELSIEKKESNFIKDILAEQIELQWLALEAILSNPDILLEAVTTSIPYLGNIYRSVRTSIEFNKLWSQLEELSIQTKSIQAKHFQEINALRQELNECVSGIAPYLAVDSHHENFVKGVILESIQELKKESCRERRCAYVKLIVQATKIHGSSAQYEHQKAMATFKLLTQPHLKILAMSVAAQDYVNRRKKSWKDKETTKIDIKTETGSISLKILIRDKVTRDGSLAILPSTELAKSLGMKEEFVKIWANDLMGWGLLDSPMLFDGLRRPKSWHIDDYAMSISEYVHPKYGSSSR